MPSVLSPIELSHLVRTQPAVRLLDVRTPAEFRTAAIAGAYNVPLDQLGEHAPTILGGRAGPIVLVCQSGQRARRAYETLTAAEPSRLAPPPTSSDSGRLRIMMRTLVLRRKPRR